ncbi:polyphosphate kinase 2 [Microbulbifer sediminum]|uniref:polyphosphate kinase 2 n=1 Tax=Microbulbifer sediminum TaxID=2904250 RepID=UPI001F02FB20|nr:polyphosphate kinase 2 [Microbulbifer sediminum]
MKGQKRGDRDRKEVRRGYKAQLRNLQIRLVSLQRQLIANNLQILVLFEGRDAAGKDGTIKRIVQHLSPRETRVVALGKPSDRDTASWYFQRWVPHLPSEGEMVLFNRSWYNRAGVERVMGYCTDREYRRFMVSVVPFEQMLVNSGIQILKYYLDIDRGEQERRLEDRRRDPLKQWKVSPVDEVALAHWDEYSQARNEMFARSHTEQVPWTVVRANNKKQARLNVIRHLLRAVACPESGHHAEKPDPAIVFPYDGRELLSGRIAP